MAALQRRESVKLAATSIQKVVRGRSVRQAIAAEAAATAAMRERVEVTSDHGSIRI